MSNMSYCRFHNTLGDFRECQEALDALANGESRPLSEDELRAAKQLAVRVIRMAQSIAEIADVQVELDALTNDLIGQGIDRINADAEAADNAERE